MTTETNIELLNRTARANTAKRLGKFLALRVVMLFNMVGSNHVIIHMGGYVEIDHAKRHP